jgi:plasmid maintenance system antidote protein VapI
MATIGDTLRKAIRASDATLYRIAKDAGLDYGTLHRFDNGTRSLTLESADKLARYFGLELQPVGRKAAKQRKGKAR